MSDILDHENIPWLIVCMGLGQSFRDAARFTQVFHVGREREGWWSDQPESTGHEWEKWRKHRGYFNLWIPGCGKPIP